MVCCLFFFSSRRRHTRCALVSGVQTCALPISNIISRADRLAILHPEDRERVVQKISAAIETNQRLDIEYRIVLPGRDEVRWGFARMAPERATDGRLLGAHLDITEAKAAAEHIRRAASHDGLTASSEERPVGKGGVRPSRSGGWRMLE